MSQPNDSSATGPLDFRQVTAMLRGAERYGNDEFRPLIAAELVARAKQHHHLLPSEVEEFVHKYLPAV